MYAPRRELFIRTYIQICRSPLGLTANYFLCVRTGRPIQLYSERFTSRFPGLKHGFQGNLRILESKSLKRLSFKCLDFVDSGQWPWFQFENLNFKILKFQNSKISNLKIGLRN